MSMGTTIYGTAVRDPGLTPMIPSANVNEGVVGQTGDGGLHMVKLLLQHPYRCTIICFILLSKSIFTLVFEAVWPCPLWATVETFPHKRITKGLSVTSLLPGRSAH